MDRISALMECLGLALCDKGRRPLFGDGKYGDALPDVAKAMLDYAHKELPTDELRLALGELAALTPDMYSARVANLIEGLSKVHSIPFRQALIDYLAGWPAAVRQALRRPSDPTGKTAPDALQFYKPDDLLLFLPPRPPRFKAGTKLPKLDNWELAELRGLGECSEVWIGKKDALGDEARVCLKFATDLGTAEQVLAHQEFFVKAFEMNQTAGVVPLRAVYLESDPPCLEYSFVSGYDLTALMYDWKWRFDAAKPEAALKLMRRLTDIVAKIHKHGIVHRDLKPSNVLLHPTDGGKFTLWVTDLGWGQIEASRSVELSRSGTPRGEQHRLSLRGAHTPLYASPQLTKKEPPDPRDDVHALGVIWYQLLKRDPHTPGPVGNEWVEEFRSAGFTDSQAKLLNACLATRPEKRPNDAASLAEMLANVSVAAATAPDGSAIIPLKSGSSEHGLVTGGPKSGRFLRETTPPKSGTMAAVGATAAGLTRLVSNSIGMTFALIPAGKFQMGSEEGEPGRREHEGPHHEVTLTQPFYLGILPVTQGQYERVTNRHPSHFSKHHGGGPDYPVETVSWHDAENFCQKLSLLADEEIHGRAYRLPTEAEWEYACRAGTITPFNCGEKLTPKEAHYASAGAFAKTGGSGKTAAAGSLPANPWGLHDMHGNVQEWVQDWYDEYYYFDSPKEDPQGPAKGNLKVTRGGCWVMFPNDCRSAARRPHAPDSPSNAIGFRVVLVSGKGG